MHTRDYDFETRKCKKCGTLVAPDKKSLEAHTQADCLQDMFYETEKEKKLEKYREQTFDVNYGGGI